MPDPKHPEASVIICVRNGGATIRRQLEALDAQEDAPAFEVIVVDNGSTDDTLDVVREWQARTRHATDEIRIVDAGGRPGIPRARNIGATAARGRRLLFCDADDRVCPGWVAAFVRGVDDGQLAGGRILAFDGQGVEHPEVFGPGLMESPYLPHVGNANCAVDRAAFFAAGGYDESLPRYGFEDVDLSWRMQEAGFPIVYVPGAVVHFTMSGAGTSLRKKFMLGRGRVLMASRYPLYDNRRYTARVVLRDVISTSLGALRASLRQRSVDRASAGRVVAAVGRVHGYIDYVLLRRLPERELLGTGRDS